MVTWNAVRRVGTPCPRETLHGVGFGTRTKRVGTGSSPAAPTLRETATDEVDAVVPKAFAPHALSLYGFEFTRFQIAFEGTA